MKKSSFKNIPMLVLLAIGLFIGTTANSQVLSTTTILSSKIDLVTVDRVNQKIDVYYHFELHSSSLQKNSRYRVTWKTEARYSGLPGYQVNFHHSPAASNLRVGGGSLSMNAISGSGTANSTNSAMGSFDGNLGEESPGYLIIDLIDDAPIDEACEFIAEHFISVGVIDPEIQDAWGKATVEYVMNFWDEHCLTTDDEGTIGIDPPKLKSNQTTTEELVDPNPFHGNVQVNLNTEMGPSVTRVMDMSGKVWVTQKSKAGNVLHLNLQHLPQGSYILRVDDGKTHKQKMIIKN